MFLFFFLGLLLFIVTMRGFVAANEDVYMRICVLTTLIQYYVVERTAPACRSLSNLAVH